MKHILTLGAAAIALAFTACDNIDEQDRFIKVDIKETDKVILIEEFTGSNCPNCPNGAAAVASIHEQYGDQVIAVSLYPSQLTDLTRPFNVDMRTQIATEIFAQYNQENKIPAALFNRNIIGGKAMQSDPANWGTPVYNILNDEESAYAPVDIQLSSNYDTADASRTLTVNYDVKFTHEVEEAVSFQIYVLENGIVSLQASTGGIIPNYVNNHVLRAGMNGTWGEEYGSSHKVGDMISGSSTIQLDSKWNADNIEIVGFLCYSGGNRTVLHAARLKSIVETEVTE